MRAPLLSVGETRIFRQTEPVNNRLVAHRLS